MGSRDEVERARLEAEAPLALYLEARISKAASRIVCLVRRANCSIARIGRSVAGVRAHIRNGQRVGIATARGTAVISLIALLAACGQSGSEPAPAKKPRPQASRPSPRPDDVQCAKLTTKQAAHSLARKLVDRVVAPDGQSERQTAGIIGESLYATCRQPHLPGVPDISRYRPVKPVLAAVQRDFDEEAIAGG